MKSIIISFAFFFIQNIAHGQATVQMPDFSGHIHSISCNLRSILGVNGADSAIAKLLATNTQAIKDGEIILNGRSEDGTFSFRVGINKSNFLNVQIKDEKTGQTASSFVEGSFDYSVPKSLITTQLDKTSVGTVILNCKTDYTP